MGRLRLLPILCGVALSAVLPGCFHSYHAANILVKDAETGQPVPNAEVGTSYHTKCDPFAPNPSTAVTGPDGRATLRIAPYHMGNHFYAKVGEKYAYRDIEATEVERLPRWWSWLMSGNHSGQPIDFIIDLPTNGQSIAASRPKANSRRLTSPLDNPK